MKVSGALCRGNSRGTYIHTKKHTEAPKNDTYHLCSRVNGPPKITESYETFLPFYDVC